MLSFFGGSHLARQDDRIDGIEQVHAALRESIEAVKLLAEDADGMLRRRRKPVEEPRPEPRMPGPA